MTEVHPCDAHRGILSPNFPWGRVLEVATACKRCEVKE